MTLSLVMKVKLVCDLNDDTHGKREGHVLRAVWRNCYERKDTAGSSRTKLVVVFCLILKDLWLLSL